MSLLDPSARLVIGHRGDRIHAPENTLAAFARAIAAGADALELDVRLTADGHVVVCHDPTVDRTTDGSGEVALMSLAEIRELDAGARWSPHADPDRANGGVRGGATPFAQSGIRVPLLGEVLDAFPATPLIIELKSVAVSERATELVRARRGRRDALLASFLDAALAAPRRAGLATGAARTELSGLMWRAALGRTFAGHRAFDAIAMPPTRFGLPLPVAGYVRACGVPVHIWTVNDPAAAQRLWRSGASGIITDDPTLVGTARP